jgi:hypothetical protein
MRFNDLKKAAPSSVRFSDRPCCGGCYKYCLRGKGCTLGVLFETSVDVCFEWLTEDGHPVSYGPEIRYKAWPKREVARLMADGVWEPEGAPSSAVADMEPASA